MNQRQHEDQLALPDMPTTLFSCSPSKLLSWDTCARQYFYRYLQRPTLKSTRSAHLSLGTSIHQVLADIYVLPTPQRSPELVAPTLARRWLRDGYRDKDQEHACRELAQGWLEDYLDSPAAHLQAEPVGIERSIATKTDRLAINGRIDRIDERAQPDGRRELAIVDYKTGRQPSTEDDARTSLPMALYSLATWRTLRQRSARVELHHLPSGTVASFEHDEASLRRKVAEAESIAQDIVAAETAWKANKTELAQEHYFAPRPVAGLCRWCDFHPVCEAGQSVTDPAESWAGVEHLA